MFLQVLLAMALILSLVAPAAVAGASGAVRLPDNHADNTFLAADGSGPAWETALNTPEAEVNPMVAAGEYYTVGLKADGTVVAVGRSDFGQCDVGSWEDIIYGTAGSAHTVGLKDDGTVVAVGGGAYGQCDVGAWEDIIQVAAGWVHTVGLKDDGTVVAVGDNYNGQCDVGGWGGIVQVAAGSLYTVGLKSDGTVGTVGNNDGGQCNVGGWTDIAQVAAGKIHTVGLKSDGTVVAVGRNDGGQCNVGDWTDIAQVAAGGQYTVGLKSDGTVVAVGYNGNGQCDSGNWTNITQIAAGAGHAVGLKDDGTVVAVGHNYYGQCDVGDWNLVLALPPSQCVLTISSTAGGSITTPGEGTFSYDKGTAVDLVAEPEEGYWFTHWAGDLDTISDVTVATANITMDEPYAITANFESEAQEGQAGISAGDWIKIEYTISGWPAGQPHPEWLELEFITVEGTSASVEVTMGMSDGADQSDTVPVDLGEGGGEAFGLSGFVIPPNLGRGDSIYFSGYGDVTIEGETMRTYAGVRRRVVYASLSQSVPPESEVQLSYYWDKETGVMVEASTIWGDVTIMCKVTETNMLEADSPDVGVQWWLWVIIAAIIVAVAFAVYRLRKRKMSTAPARLPEGS